MYRRVFVKNSQRFVLFAIFAYLAAGASTASAMQCIERPLEQNIVAANAVFEGKVISREPLDEENSVCWKRDSSELHKLCGSKIAQMEVTKVWKGAVGKTVSIYSPDGCYCLGSYFAQGSRYLVFAQKDKENSHAGPKADFSVTSVCEGSMDLQDQRSAVVIMELEKSVMSKHAP